ncbi:MAG: hypothetical protein JRJ73_01605 [Deltaproteobacteria bacterium]|nr:hypothetical protein [Deltaproteobacteria bacterium]
MPSQKYSMDQSHFAPLHLHCSVSEAVLNTAAASAKRGSIPLQRQRSGVHEFG